jgi:hypothetical protein
MFRVPFAVALLNYMRSGTLYRIFPQTWTFRGVFSIYSIINIARRISEAAMGWAGDIIFHIAGFLLYIIIRQKDQRCCDGQGGG